MSIVKIAADNEQFKQKPLWISRGIGAGVGTAVGVGLHKMIKKSKKPYFMLAGATGGLIAGGIANKMHQTSQKLKEPRYKKHDFISLYKHLSENTPNENVPEFSRLARQS